MKKDMLAPRITEKVNDFLFQLLETEDQDIIGDIKCDLSPVQLYDELVQRLRESIVIENGHILYQLNNIMNSPLHTESEIINIMLKWCSEADQYEKMILRKHGIDDILENFTLSTSEKIMFLSKILKEQIIVTSEL